MPSTSEEHPTADQPTQSAEPTAGQPSQLMDPNTGQPNPSADPNAASQPVDPRANLTKKPSDDPVWQQGYAAGLANPNGDCPTPSPYPADAAAIYQDGVANGQAVGRQQPDQSVDPSSGPNQSIDLDAGQPNQSVDPDAGQPNQSVDPGVEPNQSTDPNSGLPNQSVDPSIGPNQSIDPNSIPGPNRSVDPASGQPNESVNPPPVKDTPTPNKTVKELYQQGYADGRSGRGAVCPAHADVAGEKAYNRGYEKGKVAPRDLPMGSERPPEARGQTKEEREQLEEMKEKLRKRMEAGESLEEWEYEIIGISKEKAIEKEMEILERERDEKERENL